MLLPRRQSWSTVLPLTVRVCTLEGSRAGLDSSLLLGQDISCHCQHVCPCIHSGGSKLSSVVWYQTLQPQLSLQASKYTREKAKSAKKIQLQALSPDSTPQTKVEAAITCRRNPASSGPLQQALWPDLILNSVVMALSRVEAPVCTWLWLWPSNSTASPPTHVAAASPQERRHGLC